MGLAPRYYYHYTTEASWETIIREGVIRAGRGGKVFLSPDFYANATEAAERLSVTDKELQCVVRLEAGLISGNPQASTVERFLIRETGEVRRQGGGLEIALDGDLRLPMTLLRLT